MKNRKAKGQEGGIGGGGSMVFEILRQIPDVDPRRISGATQIRCKKQRRKTEKEEHESNGPIVFISVATESSCDQIVRN